MTGNKDVASDACIRFRLTIAYDGTGYAGWQVQHSGIGVQQRVEEALRRIFPGVTRIHGSSRTDTGVHAEGMVAHVDVLRSECNIPPAKILLAVNAHLPPDVRLFAVRKVASDFHARFDARGKEYRYRVWNHSAHHPLLSRISWHVPRKLNIGVMQTAATHFAGRHDFKSFAAQAGYEVSSTVRTLTQCKVLRKGPLLTFVIQGDGFLYKMCRGIVGTIVQVGLGKFSHTEIPGMFENRDRRVAGMSAPAHGLVLCKVFY